MAFGGHNESGAVPPSASAPLLIGAGNRVTLIVDNRRFVVDPALFARKPETVLARMFAPFRGHHATRPNERGEYEVPGDLSAATFGAILEYYRTGFLDCPPGVTFPELREACDHLLIPFDAQSVRFLNLKGFLHDLSDERARLQFEKFLEDVLFHRLVSAAQKGERECHIVVLLDDDPFELDEESATLTGDEPSQIIYSTAMYRFFKYLENRDVAKQVLRERGLIKTRLSMESFPTSKEKTRRPGGRIEGRYNYVQRPCMWVSWEADEIRRSYVDYERVKLTSVTNVSNPVDRSPPVGNPAAFQQAVRVEAPVVVVGANAGGAANRPVVVHGYPQELGAVGGGDLQEAPDVPEEEGDVFPDD